MQNTSCTRPSPRILVAPPSTAAGGGQRQPRQAGPIQSDEQPDPDQHTDRDPPQTVLGTVHRRPRLPSRPRHSWTRPAPTYRRTAAATADRYRPLLLTVHLELSRILNIPIAGPPTGTLISYESLLERDCIWLADFDPSATHRLCGRPADRPRHRAHRRALETAQRTHPTNTSPSCSSGTLLGTVHSGDIALRSIFAAAARPARPQPLSPGGRGDRGQDCPLLQTRITNSVESSTFPGTASRHRLLSRSFRESYAAVIWSGGHHR
jgi:hypothetical protein